MLKYYPVFLALSTTIQVLLKYFRLNQGKYVWDNLKLRSITDTGGS